ncbi:hypothetical protein ABT56_15395 [Photobacterium aquae]|uniref:Lysozyme inhibitor LprI-like N-terminal domain-containing protein n=1 Tax=Photobacterium aquae TaxID=1195763 RepID=A0A0J1GX38_9GAMM|nr:lysozyme inhibitor LprI family protein [Photobacterium aquae]KLV04014.1 hypothetical protein ABT56_15395 [Photobacterium aquae]
MKKLLPIMLTVISLSASATEDPLDCENAFTTIDMNRCAAIERDAARVEMERYLNASLAHNAHDPELIEAIKQAQQDWEQYADSHCKSVYTLWRDGTIRGVMGISCQIETLQQRTHDLWANFLTYMDNTPAVLPEPKR